MKKTESEVYENTRSENRYYNMRVSQETFSALMRYMGASPCFPLEEKQEEKKEKDQISGK